MYKSIAAITLITIAATMVSCTEYNMVNTIVIEDRHEHSMIITHSHPSGGSMHEHTNQELINEISELYNQPGTTHEPNTHVPHQDNNPFSRVITAAQEILEMEGGDKLLEIAMSRRTNDQKVRAIFLMPNSRAKTQMIEAYTKHAEWIDQMIQIISMVDNPTKVKPKPNNPNNIVQGTNINPQ